MNDVAMNEETTVTTIGALVYDEARDCLFLDGHELSRGENIEIRVFGSWLPGQVAYDSAGWYLVTLDQVGIRLHTGLRARSSEFRFAEPSDTRTLPANSSPVVLIVDDDPALLQALPRTISLRIPQARVETASSAQEALARIQVQHFDTIISDIKMPGMDGLVLLAKIQEVQPLTPTILITGHGEHNLAIQALRGGAYDYIQKPIERDNFVAAVLRAIQTCQLRRQVHEQQSALEMYTRSLERLVAQRTKELADAHTTKDKVVSLVSHEMKEPVARLKSITQLLRQKLSGAELSEIVTQIFADIEVSIERTEHLVKELLNTSDIETQRFILHRQRFDLVQLCQHVLDEEVAHAHIQLTASKVEGALDVEVDEQQICQVLRLLLDGARVALAQDISLSLQQAGKEAILSMRYAQGTRAGLGTGLHVSRKIVERHGGHLETQSFPESRKAVFMVLPLFQRQQDPDEAASATIPQTRAYWTLSFDEEYISSQPGVEM